MKIIKKAIKLAQSKAKENNYGEVETICDQILKINPDNIKALYLSAIAKQKLSKNEESKKYFEKILEITPNDFDAFSHMATSYLYANDLDKAIEFYIKAINIKPKDPIAWSNLGCQFRSKKQYESAIRCLEEAKKLSKNKNPQILTNLAGAYAENLQINESIKNLKKALRINPKLPCANFDLACAYGLKGKIKKVWKHYDYRFKNFEYLKSIIKNFSKNKRWKGENIEDGKTILFFSEQGIGDSINFIRFVTNFKNKFPNVIIKILCSSSLFNLFSSFEGLTESIENHDFWCPLMDLPNNLNLNKKQIEECYKPYLMTNKKCDYSSFSNYYKIGICWAGNPKHPKDEDRCCHLSNFKEIFNIKNVKLFSLQKDLRPRMWPYKKEPVDLSNCADMKLVNMGPHMQNWEDTASIIQDLDLVISVDTSILHLSGAIGKKTFGILPYFPDWRWGIKSEKTFWYPNLKLFRQKDPGNWSYVFDKLRKEVIIEKNLFFQKHN